MEHLHESEYSAARRPPQTLQRQSVTECIWIAGVSRRRRKREEGAKVKLKIYTRRHSPFCVRALRILRQAGLTEYEEVPIDGREGQLRREIMESTGGRWDVPQVFVDGSHIGDDDDLATLASSGELARLISGQA